MRTCSTLLMYANKHVPYFKYPCPTFAMAMLEIGAVIYIYIYVCTRHVCIGSYKKKVGRYASR